MELHPKIRTGEDLWPVADDHPKHRSRSSKRKNRSVYGQPHINNQQQQQQQQEMTTAQPETRTGNWKSLESLDNYNGCCGDSVQSFESNSTSLSDLRILDFADLNGDAGGKASTSVVVSDLGTSVESSDNEHERCPSSTSSSGCSVELRSPADDLVSREAKYFMKRFVERIFADSSAISLEEKAEFGRFARMEPGRVWFARCINKKRNENKCVTESTFYSLAQYFAIVLFECAESDDFAPAKLLMNMCFTYYHQSTGVMGSRSGRTVDNPQYLYTVLRDQPIWKLIRFWNAAFFDAVQCERENFYENEPKNRFYDWQFHANVTFGQLGTFTHNMHSFGLPKAFCLQFFQKQSTIANLTSEQIQTLRDIIEEMYQSRPMSNALC